MPQSITAKELIARWIESALAKKQARGDALNVRFKTHKLQTDFIGWIKKKYDEVYTPATIQRRFRELKEPYDETAQAHGIKWINKASREDESREATWVVQGHPRHNFTDWTQA